MAELLTKNKLILHGKSGKRYYFDLFPVNEPYPNQTGVYFFSNRHPLDDQYNHKLIYLGAAKSFLKELENHPQKEVIFQQEANCIGLLLNLSQTDQANIVMDLLINNPTTCNQEVAA